MIDFTSVVATHDINTDFILSRIDESQIFSYYHGHFELNQLHPSKLRTDKHPSSSFFVSTKTGSILYKDFATNKVYNCFTFVAALYNITFVDALNTIARDFGLSDVRTMTPEAANVLKNTDFDKSIKAQTLLQIIPARWTETHRKYWKQYHIEVDQLIRNNVFPVACLFINKKQANIDELCFSYLVKHTDEEGKYHEYLKIYQPLRANDQGKWINNVPISVPFGLYELNYNNPHIIITKSKKDEMVLQHFFKSTIGTQNESESALSDTLVHKLSASFPTRTIIWDADSVGVESCKKFNAKGFGYFNTPAYLVDRGIKDVSDYVKAFGMKALERLLKSKKLI
jgi:hypothetical protein